MRRSSTTTTTTAATAGRCTIAACLRRYVWCTIYSFVGLLLLLVVVHLLRRLPKLLYKTTRKTHTHTDAPRNSLAYFSITICACVFIFYPDAGAAERSRFGRVWDNCARVRIRTNFRVYADFATAERHTNKQLKLYTLEFSFAEDNTHDIFEVENTNHCMWPSICLSNIVQ